MGNFKYYWGNGLIIKITENKIDPKYFKAFGFKYKINNKKKLLQNLF